MEGIVSQTTRHGQIGSLYVNTLWNVGAPHIWVVVNGVHMTASEARKLAEILKGAAHVAELNQPPAPAEVQS